MTTTTKTARAAKASATIAPEPKAIGPRPDSKIGMVIALLGRDEGATLAEMTDTTGWQPHSARAALTGLRKKGRVIVTSRRGDVTCYRIAG